MQECPDFKAAALEPSPQLAPGEEPGSWVAGGSDPHFILRRSFPAGWVHVHLDIASDLESEVELSLESEDGPGEPIPLGAIRKSLRVDRYIRLDRPVRAIRLDPLAQPGKFRLNAFTVRRVSRLWLLLRALASKLKELQSRRSFGSALAKGGRLLLSGEFRTVMAKLVQSLGGPASGEVLYWIWCQQHKLNATARARMRAEADGMTDPPRFAILMLLAGARAEDLSSSLESLLRQVYPHWELRLAGADALDPRTRAIVAQYAERDGRIKVEPTPSPCPLPQGEGDVGRFAESPGRLGKSPHTLPAGEREYVALLDAGDELAEEALLAMARALKANPTLDVLYSDEDCVDRRGRRSRPFFKPDWSPEYFLAYPYTGRLAFYRAVLVGESVAQAVSLRQAEPALLLRLLSRGARVGHVRSVLYHARAAAETASEPEARVTAAQELVRRALQEHLAATGREGTVEPGPRPGTSRVRFAISGPSSSACPNGDRPKVSIIIPSRCQPPKGDPQGVPYVVRCVESIVQKSTYKEYEILVLDRNEMPEALETKFKSLGARRVRYADPFNWSRVNNLGASQAAGSQFLFLNDDVEVLTPDWLESLLEFSQQPEIGTVGAKLFFPDGRLQHAGVFIIHGSPGHPYYGAPGDDPGYFYSNIVPRNYSAVTGACLMTRAEVFKAAGGFDETFSLNYNDVDYCLKVLRSGKRVVCTPFAQLLHHESVSKAGVFRAELARFRKRWPEWSEEDPCFSAHALQFTGV
ncbi:MAG: glycosyltransferase [Planctomycetota bacterium]